MTGPLLTVYRPSTLNFAPIEETIGLISSGFILAVKWNDKMSSLFDIQLLGIIDYFLFFGMFLY